MISPKLCFVVHISSARCEKDERERIRRNFQQPASAQLNYTFYGGLETPLPSGVGDAILAFWKDNQVWRATYRRFIVHHLPALWYMLQNFMTARCLSGATQYWPSECNRFHLLHFPSLSWGLPACGSLLVCIFVFFLRAVATACVMSAFCALLD